MLTNNIRTVTLEQGKGRRLSHSIFNSVVSWGSYFKVSEKPAP